MNKPRELIETIAKSLSELLKDYDGFIVQSSNGFDKGITCVIGNKKFTKRLSILLDGNGKITRVIRITAENKIDTSAYDPSKIDEYLEWLAK